MSVQWSLSGEKQTWGGLPISVAIDPEQTICSSREAPEREFFPTVWTLRVPGAAMVINAGEAIQRSLSHNR